MTKKAKTVTTIDNYFGGKHVPPSNNQYIDVINPATGDTLASVASSPPQDVAAAVDSAHKAFQTWSKQTIKARAACMLKLHSLIRQHTDELAQLIVAENGKNYTEAVADVAKANETVEYACSLPQLAAGRILPVSAEHTVVCHDKRVPLGVVVSIVPFNFPLMVPCWTLPIALVMGNAVILKPSEKVPMTTHRLLDWVEQAGFPPGVLTVLHTHQPATVQTLLAHPTVQAVTFVGSSPVAQLVAETCRTHRKRCTALGGAKNHLVALLPDCDVPSTASDVVVSFAGCAGQRCMAASVLLLVGANGATDTDKNTPDEWLLLSAIVEKAKAIQPGTQPGQMGPVIDQASFDKIHKYIAHSVNECGAQLLLDGRDWSKNSDLGNSGGHWVGPTILLHSSSSNDKTMHEEVFGPVLSVYKCQSWDEAIQLENNNPFGNAACIYTTNGGHAEWFLNRFRAGMLGCNIGIPVPREPFSFGGLYGTRSKYGDMDITGDAGMEFFSNRIKVTTRWPMTTAMSANNNTNNTINTTTSGSSANATVDAANFAGRM